MCISYKNEISFGESWTATITPITGNTQYEEAAYIFSQGGTTADSIAESQWANWELFDPNDPNLLANLPSLYHSSVSTLLAAALTYADNPANAGSIIYSEYVIYVPVPGTQPSGDNLPQNLIGAAPDLAPEPGTLVLLGSGLLGLAVLVYRRRCLDKAPCLAASRL